MPRFNVRTTLYPADPVRASHLLEIIHRGQVTEQQFNELFPGTAIQDALCREGTNDEGRPYTINPSEVLECERPTDAGPSHQSLFVEALLTLEGAGPPPIEQIRARAKDWDTIDPQALSYLLITADGYRDPTHYICMDMARIARAAGINSADILEPADASPAP